MCLLSLPTRGPFVHPTQSVRVYMFAGCQRVATTKPVLPRRVATRVYCLCSRQVSCDATLDATLGVRWHGFAAEGAVHTHRAAPAHHARHHHCHPARLTLSGEGPLLLENKSRSIEMASAIRTVKWNVSYLAFLSKLCSIFSWESWERAAGTCAWILLSLWNSTVWGTSRVIYKYMYDACLQDSGVCARCCKWRIATPPCQAKTA